MVKKRRLAKKDCPPSKRVYASLQEDAPVENIDAHVPTTFHSFQALPIELRRWIWQCALRSIDEPALYCYVWELFESPQTLHRIGIPLLVHLVNKEAYRVAKEWCRLNGFNERVKPLGSPSLISSYTPRLLRGFDPSRDAYYIPEGMFSGITRFISEFRSLFLNETPESRAASSRPTIGTIAVSERLLYDKKLYTALCSALQDFYTRSDIRKLLIVRDPPPMWGIPHLGCVFKPMEQLGVKGFIWQNGQMLECKGRRKDHLNRFSLSLELDTHALAMQDLTVQVVSAFRF